MSFRSYRDDAESDVKSAHQNLAMALSQSDSDEYDDNHLDDMHKALSMLNEIKQLFK